MDILRTKKRAFTLAEVLITLAVVGIVAASTIPAVVTKLTRQEYVTKLQKAHNTLSNAFRAAELEYGPAEFWSNADGKFVEKHFLSQLDILTSCGLSASNGLCFGAVRNLNDNTDFIPIMMGPFLRQSSPTTGNAYRFITTDGIAYAYDNGANAASNTMQSLRTNAHIVWVDVNGPKPPNVLGRDVFAFFIRAETSETSAHPMRGVFALGAVNINGNYISDSSVRDTNATYGCTRNSSASAGLYCAGKVLSEGGMNY
ncbi:pilin subunit PilA [Candidatus Gastranaerophilus sp. (ex Termes propinquus)]|nr:pilin subunit PilA [Candidatus Gastranaerophilus sp. (ex Termes propinquus)]